MRKIPTYFERDPQDRKHVVPVVTPGCEWVQRGEGVATRKFDGTCVLVVHDQGEVLEGYARREVKPGKQPPANFVEIEHDPITGKTVGWEPIEQSGFHQFFIEAANALSDELGRAVPSGTYELVGPKINGNPERYGRHALVRHGDWLLDGPDAWVGDPTPHVPPRDFEGLRAWLLDRSDEGIVWHHPDGRMAKLKRKDFL